MRISIGGLNISELCDRTNFSVNQTHELQNAIEMFTFSIFERWNDYIMKFAFVLLIEE